MEKLTEEIPEGTEAAVRGACREVVEQGLRDAAGLIRVDAILKASVEARVRDRLGPEIACKKGCGHCCRVSVSSFPFEIFAIVDHVRGTWSGWERWKLRRRIRRYRDAFGQSTHPWCPFLKEGACSIYAVRPTICRTHHSTDLAQCIAGLESWPAGAEPFYLATLPLYDGVYEALGERGGLPSGLDMAAAVGILLDRPSVKEEFLAGGDPFVSARREMLRRWGG